MAEDNRDGSGPPSSEGTSSKRFGKQVGSWMDDIIAEGRSNTASTKVDPGPDPEAPPSWTFKPLVPDAPPPPPPEPIPDEEPAPKRTYWLAATLAVVVVGAALTWFFTSG